MTPREKMTAALSPEGSPELPAALIYHSLLLRDLWDQLTDQPWWTAYESDPDLLSRPAIDMYARLNDDWFRLFPCAPRAVRSALRLEREGDRVFRVNTATGERTELHRPPVGGDQSGAAHSKDGMLNDCTNRDELDALLDRLLPATEGHTRPSEDGRADAPRRILARFAAHKLPYVYIPVPTWRLFSIFGFENLMRGAYDFPETIDYANRRLLEYHLRSVEESADLGAECIWLEEAMTDMFGPEQYRRNVFPSVRRMTEAIHAAGMRAVHYFCGDPAGKWEMLLDADTDALALEEGRKGFENRIEEIVERVGGRMTVFGNLASWEVLERASDDDLRAQIARHVRAGRRNRSRFVMSLGSPVTPGTSLARLNRYCELAHALGRP